jgi:hypothetical protein
MLNSRSAKLSLAMLALSGALAGAEIDRIWLTQRKTLAGRDAESGWESVGSKGDFAAAIERH